MPDAIAALLSLTPQAGALPDWPHILQSPLAPLLAPMADTPQNPLWHGEGDVLTHTRMVCDALVALPTWQALPAREGAAVFLAALLHDVGKPATTRLEGGALVSPHHAATGARMARQTLWASCGLGGEPEALALRELICMLIRYHTGPLHALDWPQPERRLRRMAADGLLAKGFNIALLCLLAEADVRGRIAADTAQQLEQTALCAELAAEAGCLTAAYPFPDSHTRHAYLGGRAVPPDVPLFDDTWGPVVMLSGLPGIGKDAYIRKHFAGLPMVSLDEVRRCMGVPPHRPQGAVANAAKELAMLHLRRHEPFVWNATCLTPAQRDKQLALFARYGAATRIVYLETGWTELLRRNASRAEAVPERVLSEMLADLTPPAVSEARDVEWLCV